MKRHALAALFAVAACTPAIAHHGWTGQEDVLVNLTGVVIKPVSLSGPHGTMQIRVNNEVWDITLAPPARTAQTGLNEKAIPVGATVTVRGNKGTRDGRNEMKTVRVTHGNKVYRVYADRDV